MRDRNSLIIILVIPFLSVLVFLYAAEGWCGEPEPSEYPHYFYESTFHNLNIMMDGKEVPINFDREHSDPEALRSFDALKWNILYPNSKGKIRVIGYLGQEIERPYGERVHLFVLLDWYLPAPFEYVYIKNKEEALPFEYATRIKPALDREDFKTDISNPRKYNRF